MRKLFSFVLSALALVPFTLAPFVMQGCGEGEKIAAPDESSVVISGWVVEGSSPAEARVLALWPDGSDQIVETDSKGAFALFCANAPERIVAMAFGKSGVHEGPFPVGQDVTISLSDVPTASEVGNESTDLAEYWFGVYDTDSHGDVRFRYQYSFARFVCINWMPYLGEGGPNPNYWTSWSLTDFPPPWQGKKLLVPRRYQTYHRWVYGYSISGALYLISVR